MTPGDPADFRGGAGEITATVSHAWKDSMESDPRMDARARAREIFMEALDFVDSSTRDGYVASACGLDRDLQARVDSMLSEHFVEDGFMAAPAVREMNGLVPDEIPGTRIGRYRIERKLGEGGMGVVYLAEQQEPVRRRVALKIVKLGMDTRQVVARFEAERQVLAMMDHPGIARVLDCGATETGRPYFVMDWVDGLPITEFCSRFQLSTADRIRLLITVCQAVQSAHQKGIIHRDLKPSNVLVSRHEGVVVPKVIDFGVAKATHQRLTERTLFTAHSALIGTPAYMSPEQSLASNLDIDTRTDVYSLGVLLYELLTGSTPFPDKHLRQVSLSEMQRIILHDEPDRPSTRQRKSLGSGGRPARFSSDLDWIVMKCLEKDRNRRYETANGLAFDLQRFLDNDPVLARPPSPGYRFQKLIRRHRLQFAAFAVVGLVLTFASLLSTWLAWKAIHAQRSAREEAVTAKAVQGFLLDEILAPTSPWVQSKHDPSSRIVVERIARALEGKLAHQPRVEAEIRHALGKAMNDAYEDFRGALVHHQRAYDLRRRHLGPTHSDTLAAAAALGLALHDVGRHQEADLLLDEAIAYARELGRTVERLRGLPSLLPGNSSRNEQARQVPCGLLAAGATTCSRRMALRGFSSVPPASIHKVGPTWR